VKPSDWIEAEAERQIGLLNLDKSMPYYPMLVTQAKVQATIMYLDEQAEKS